MYKIILSTFLLLFPLLKMQAQDIKPSEKISDKYKIDLAQLQSQEAAEIQNKSYAQHIPSTTLNSAQEAINPKERLQRLQAQKNNLLQSIKDLEAENNANLLQPMIDKFHLALSKTEAEILSLETLIKE